MLHLFDRADIGNGRITRDGYMVTEAKVARAGIQLYRGSEVEDEQNRPVVRVYRPEEEVFNEDAMRSVTHRPVTNDHPSKLVSAENWRDHTVGMTGDQVARDGHFIRVPFTLMDAGAIADVGNGKRELSMGYTCVIDWSPGVTPDGQEYDAVQRNIVANHLAVVDTARAGPSCRIGDKDPQPLQLQKEPSMPDNLRPVLVDGISISVTDQGAQAIEKLQKQLADKQTMLDAAAASTETLKAEHQRALDAKAGQMAALDAEKQRVVDAKDGEIAALNAAHTTALEAKEGEIAGLRQQIPDAATLDALLEQREAVRTSARKLLGDKAPDFKGSSAADIRRAAVVARLGDAAVAGKSDEYVEACFDTMAKVAAGQPASDPLRQAIRANAPLSDAQPKPNQQWLDHLANAYKTAGGAKTLAS